MNSYNYITFDCSSSRVRQILRKIVTATVDARYFAPFFIFLFYEKGDVEKTREENAGMGEKRKKEENKGSEADTLITYIINNNSASWNNKETKPT